MENASKALIIAGGVFLTIIVIGALVFVWSKTGAFNSSIEDVKEMEQITAFNKSFESYQKTLLRGTDVASVINKVRNNNKIYADNPEYQIEWEMTFEDAGAGLSNGTYKESNSANYNNMLNNEKKFKEFKGLYFKCEEIKYNPNTGRVSKIKFVKYTQDQISKWLNETTV